MTNMKQAVGYVQSAMRTSLERDPRFSEEYRTIVMGKLTRVINSLLEEPQTGTFSTGVMLS
jgi:hypothetical protein